MIAALCTLLGATARAQETALGELRAAAKGAPTDLRAQIALGRALIEAGHLEEAATQMNTVVRLGKGSMESLYETRRVDFASGDYKRVRNGCRALSAKDPKHVLSDVCMARAYLVWRRTSEAFEFIDKALATDPHNYEALLAQADAKRMQGDLGAAAEAYARAVAETHDGADAELGMGITLMLARQNDKALAALRTALERAPSDPDVQFELGRAVPGQESAGLLQKALMGRPSWADAELELTGALLRSGDAAGAEVHLQSILKRTPEQPIALARHGAALVALKRFADAEPVLKHALELIPNDFDTAFALAKLYEGTDRVEEAFTQYRGAADLKRDNPAPLIAAARLGLQLKRALLAGALLDKALERSPRSAEAMALAGEVAAERGDAKAARDFWQRALQGEGVIDRAAIQKRLSELK
jgi:tetratricopeptide (TPR) repeat protein